jgi:hypothetical protein
VPESAGDYHCTRDYHHARKEDLQNFSSRFQPSFTSPPFNLSLLSILNSNDFFDSQQQHTPSSDFNTTKYLFQFLLFFPLRDKYITSGYTNYPSDELQNFKRQRPISHQKSDM